jgi:carbon storage regulator
MLVLSRREFEEILIGDDIKITVLRCEHGHVRIGIDAPQSVNIVRAELLEGKEEGLSQSRFGNVAK